MVSNASYLLLLVLGFLITISSEVLVAWLMGLKRSIELKIVILVSTVTYPVLNGLILLYRLIFFRPYPVVLTYFLEIIVVIIEGSLLYYVFKQKYSAQKLFLIALVMNAVSYGIGLLIF